MIPERNLEQILGPLRDAGTIDPNAAATKRLSGTTDGIVYLLTVEDRPAYILKLDDAESIADAGLLHSSYEDCPLLPRIRHLDPDGNFLVYDYLEGTTHTGRGPKTDWLILLTEQLFNRYAEYKGSAKWGRFDMPRETWREFNERSIEGARANLGGLLSVEDYLKVRSIAERLPEPERKWLLHGDTGIHNFVFRRQELVGVIDPSPIVGPVLYDFTYAFCSSPDDLNLKTLCAAFHLLDCEPIGRQRLIEEVVVQLYCRIGICAKVHPDDLEPYLEAWQDWKRLVG